VKFSAHSPYAIRALIEHRLSEERILIPRRSEAELLVPLCYPSPYHVGMSSLGFQVVYRLLNDPAYPRLRAERAFLPDDVDAWRRARLPLLTYESQTAVGQSPAILFSVAYELELTGLFTCLELAAVPLLQSERGAGHPLVICGGPLTFSNPVPLGPFADIVVMGEAEEVLPRLMRDLVDAGLGDGHLLGVAERQSLLAALSGRQGLWIPSVDGEQLPKVARCEDSLLPATSAVLTPNTELRSMFLIEPERGCSRGCTYCVMRRSTNGGMRLVAPERVAALIPEGVTRVGLVGAAVTDHPKLPHILRHIVQERHLQVGISSLRADRLTDELVGLLAAGGYRTLTVAGDGASERLREVVERRTKEKHLLRSAELAAAHGMKTLKVYMIVGLPTETDDDIDELVRFGIELSKIVRTSFGVAPFVAKRNTPLDRTQFAGIAEVERRLARLRQGLGKHAEVRPTSARWAWVEYVLAQGGMDAGRRALVAHHAGGGFAAWRRAFDGWTEQHPVLASAAPSAPTSGSELGGRRRPSAGSGQRVLLPIL
jgi:radical SAM superfamily enzyme YgiQ (UPF0313 family)